MNIENNIIRHYLRNAYFITGTAYAGKSTMVKMLAEKYDMIFCGENYTSDISDKIAEITAGYTDRAFIFLDIKFQLNLID